MIGNVAGQVAPWLFQGGVAGIVVWMLLTGRLIPRRMHEERIAELRKANADLWSALRAEVARGDVRDQQFNEILSYVRQRPQSREPA